MWIDRRLLLMLGGASLLLNIFLVGLILGRTLPTEQHRPVALPPGNVGFVPLNNIRQLAPDDRKIFRTTMNAHRPGIKEAREALRAQRRATMADMVAANFDRAKVAADLVALRQANDLVLQRVHGALLDAVGALPPEARTTLLPQRKPAAGEGAPTPAKADE